MTADTRPNAAAGALQFDTAEIHAAGGAAPGLTELTCTSCQTSIRACYFEANGSILCARCKQAADSGANGGDSSRVGRMALAALYGSGAALAGAALYYAVAALTGYEIGLIAIAVGYMVGLAVRAGSRGRGGWRYQTLAVVLTHFAIGIAYFTQGMAEVKKEKERARTPAATVAAAPASTTADTMATRRSAEAAGQTREPVAERLGIGAMALGVVALAAFIAALPILAGFSEFPQHAIGLIIVGIALHQAWVMNKRVHVAITGPYMIGDRNPTGTPASPTAAPTATGAEG